MIGVLDSGIGGLSVTRKIMEQFPDYDIVYFGDTARAPYGNKNPETIIRYALENTEILLANGARAVIIASHTVSCVAGRPVRARFNVPVLDVMTPTVHLALEVTRNFAIGVMASRAAVGRNSYQEAILNVKPEAKVYSVACPLLFPLVEEGWLKKPETIRIVKKYLHPLKVRQIDTLILGGNHYTLLKRVIQRKIGQKVSIIDAADAIAEAFNNFLQNNSELEKTINKQGKHQFLVSDLTEHLLKTARSIIKRNISLKVVPRI
jgi:glutamate racemase